MWDERYAGDDYVYGTEPNDYLKAQAELFARDARVLCLAEGEGRNAVYLAEQGLNVVAVDGSAVGLAKANRLARARGVSIETRLADLAEFDLGQDQWDGIVSIFCHLPPEVRQALHQKVFNSLKPGGLFVLEAYRPEQLLFKTGGPPRAEWMMTADQLQEELAPLHFEQLQEMDRPILEGQGHTGLGAVVQAVCLKV
ncbi:SAM-dependent methyltransferase [Saccharospirillum impatiens]|uniref:SAM-dependent methyltransferase n=1 Tax=Saccharospirillum impatiens TaxID=169438 RepID=UPI000418B055|nr:class I SAM-dependent methyltransferase [Saccharospirillum impatiens]